MNRSPRQQTMYVLSIAFAAAPFGFALIRAYSTRYDLRMLWMAFASLLGATVVRAILKRRTRAPNSVLAPSALVFVVATLLAGLVARQLGATAAFGVWAVASVLGLCWAASYALDTSSRPR